MGKNKKIKELRNEKKVSIINVPNIITLFRFLLIFPLLYFLIENNIAYSIGIFILFTLLDMLDGDLARRLNQETIFGRNFDVVADFSIGVVIFLTQLLTNKIPIFIGSVAIITYIPIMILFIIGLKKKGVIFISGLKSFGALVHYWFLFLLILNIYSLVFSIIFYILLIGMWVFTIYYFYEIKNKILV
ncbi:CDP-alcohol phosphatidyltransferase family protein [Candidatus Woesearchaeota archaeon]|jgi:phosphatidylglycerophosphate synthase|nr:CDP-alcohol phosphatidyltransferase family protein [Candidatus Woesearchaeota archaeon]MBT6519625.1 CDP-alcohol phosphatidyltransferase family protein [Candidatus Woesearchaeota archaeon]MBT7367540.1 CDP-alcohol phosphatidyltransferase family protein [Candidatus Woesearchaeota archaeon]